MNSNDTSPLNIWFRQQGASITQSNFKSSSFTFKKQEQEKKQKKVKKIERLILPKLNSTKSVENCKNRHDSIISIDESINSLKNTKSSNLYHLKCIDEVSNSNRPETLRLTVPRELTYVRSIPTIKYITYGSGISNNCSWQIGIFKD